jgi:hypothetical protein
MFPFRNMTHSDQRPTATLTIGAAIVALALAGFMGSASGVPVVRSPLPLATTLPMLWLWMGVHEAPALTWVIEYAIPMLAGPLLLLSWHPKLLRGAWHVPKRSVAGLVILSVLTAADFCFGWEYGIKYQGTGYTFALMFLNTAAVGVSWALLWLARTRRRFGFTLMAHAFVVAWLVWIAFPWLGELP